MVDCWRDRQQLAAERKLLVTMAIGKEAVMADAMEAVRQGVKQEAPDELEGVESHHLRLAVMAIILPAEADAAICQADEPRIGDGNAMGVAAEIGATPALAHQRAVWRKLPTRLGAAA